jgi:peptide alpha-N-acetyltransferase
MAADLVRTEAGDVEYRPYQDEGDLPGIMALISADLSEPYSIFTYRYFIHQWPQLSFLALQSGRVIGTIICKMDEHKTGTMRGYVAMLAVDNSHRKRGIGKWLVRRATRAMRELGCDEVVLETEVTNEGAIALYESLGFVRDKRLHRYYLNGNDAFRLKIWFEQSHLDGEQPAERTSADERCTRTGVNHLSEEERVAAS